MTLAQHSAATPEHYTPLDIIEAARSVMGGIDLDPATTAKVNAERVRATHFFTRADDGFARAWRGRVWLNPPGGKWKNQSLAALWWKKLVDEFHAGRVTQAIFLGFSVEIFATSQDAPLWIGHVPFCVPRERIPFVRATESGGVPGVQHLFGEADPDFEEGDSPTHANVIAFLPPGGERVQAVTRFAVEFGRLGKVST